MNARVEKSKAWLLGALLGLVVGTVGAGVYFRHYFVVALFLVWLAVELVLWKFFRGTPIVLTGSFPRLSELLTLYGKSDAASEALLLEKMTEARFSGQLTDGERRWLERLRDLIELRGLAFGGPLKGKRALRQAFVPVGPKADYDVAAFEAITERDIAEAASAVADLYWKLYYAALGELPDLAVLARNLFEDLFGVPVSEGRGLIETATDSLQRDGGVPFLVLNLLSHGAMGPARAVTSRLLTKEVELDEEVRSTLYWIGEVLWFAEQPPSLATFESTIRYLYHLCFTDPNRAGFLEIDSQFFSEFETVSELAKEGFLFREALMDRLLSLWATYGAFSDVFRATLEVMTGQRSKVYDHREAWVRYWDREREGFGKDYLAVVEGNLCYARGHVLDAREFYEQALELNPGLRSANVNLLFCYARERDDAAFDAQKERVLRDRALGASRLSVVGNACLLMGREEESDRYYEELRAVAGDRRKGDYYRSTFCFEHGLFDRALHFARRAREACPEDASVAYHLSLCYNALGEKDRALEVLRDAPALAGRDGADWIRYYRFTLERDVGRHREATDTLMGLSPEYFEDPEELEQALEFARATRDLKLLRHLRRGSDVG